MAELRASHVPIVRFTMRETVAQQNAMTIGARKFARGRPAFSLIELVMITMLIGIIAAIAAPRFGSAIARRRINSAAQRVILDLKEARQYARITSAPVTVKFRTPATYGSSNMPQPDNPNARFEVHLDENPYFAKQLTADFDGASEVTFDIYGAPSSKGTLILRVGNEIRRIRIDAETGTPELASEESGGLDIDVATTGVFSF